MGKTSKNPTKKAAKKDGRKVKKSVGGFSYKETKDGHPHSKETRDKMRKSHQIRSLYKKTSDVEEKTAVVQYDTAKQENHTNPMFGQLVGMMWQTMCDTVPGFIENAWVRLKDKLPMDYETGEGVDANFKEMLGPDFALKIQAVEEKKTHLLENSTATPTAAHVSGNAVPLAAHQGGAIGDVPEATGKSHPTKTCSSDSETDTSNYEGSTCGDDENKKPAATSTTVTTTATSTTTDAPTTTTTVTTTTTPGVTTTISAPASLAAPGLVSPVNSDTPGASVAAAVVMAESARKHDGDVEHDKTK